MGYSVCSLKYFNPVIHDPVLPDPILNPVVKTIHTFLQSLSMLCKIKQALY